MALLSVLITGVIGITVGAALLLIGLGSERMGLMSQQMNGANAAAHACAEEALQRIHDVPSLSGNGALTLTQGTCTYTVSGSTITATGVAGTVTRIVRVIVQQTSPSVRVTSWLEVSN